MSVIYKLWSQVLCWICVLQFFFSQTIAGHFIFLMLMFEVQRFRILMRFNLTAFFFLELCVLDVISKKFLPYPGLKDFLLKTLLFLAFTFKSMIPLESVLICGVS